MTPAERLAYLRSRGVEVDVVRDMTKKPAAKPAPAPAPTVEGLNVETVTSAAVPPPAPTLVTWASLVPAFSFSAAQLSKAGFSLEEIQTAGFPAADLAAARREATRRAFRVDMQRPNASR